MENKAYDFKLLGEAFKKEGLELAEESAKVAYKAVSSWLKESAKLSENKIDDVVVLALEYADGLLMPVLEDINKSDNE